MLLPLLFDQLIMLVHHSTGLLLVVQIAAPEGGTHTQGKPQVNHGIIRIHQWIITNEVLSFAGNLIRYQTQETMEVTL